MALSGQAFAVRRTPTRTSATHRVRYRRHSRRAHFNYVLWHPLFRPTHDSLYLQNEEIDRLDLPRIQDDAQLEELKASGDLVEIVPTESLRVAPQLDPNRRYCRPWTLNFVNDLSDDFYQQFHAQIQLNSAVRTVKIQKKLRRHNRNAAPADGDRASSHLAGITVDLQRRGLTNEQIRWIEQYLVPLKEQGLIEPEEERRQWVFHIMVSARYDDWRETRMLAGNPPVEQEEVSQASDAIQAPDVQQSLPALPSFSFTSAQRSPVLQ